MSQHFRVDSLLIADWRVMLLTPAQFKKKFIAALAGQENEFTPYVTPHHNRPSPKTWARLRESVFQRDGFACRYCGEKAEKLECDHVLPVSRGGDSEIENLVTACIPCNRSKRNKTVEEWRPA